MSENEEWIKSALRNSRKKDARLTEVASELLLDLTANDLQDGKLSKADLISAATRLIAASSGNDTSVTL